MQFAVKQLVNFLMLKHTYSRSFMLVYEILINPKILHKTSFKKNRYPGINHQEMGMLVHKRENKGLFDCNL